MAPTSPTEDDMDRRVAGHLRAERELQGLSQSDVAARAGLRPSRINDYERARSRIPAGRLVVLADIIGVAPHRLLPHPNDAFEFPAATRALANWLGLTLNAIPDPRQREALLYMAHALATGTSTES